MRNARGGHETELREFGERAKVERHFGESGCVAHTHENIVGKGVFETVRNASRHRDSVAGREGAPLIVDEETDAAAEDDNEFVLTRMDVSDIDKATTRHAFKHLPVVAIGHANIVTVNGPRFASDYIFKWFLLYILLRNVNKTIVSSHTYLIIKNSFSSSQLSRQVSL